MNITGINNIKIQRVPGGFLARNSTGHSGGGNTMAEAIGVLILTCPDMFDVSSIEYDNDQATRVYVIERGLNKQIATGHNNG